MQITDTMKHRDKKNGIPSERGGCHILYFIQVPHVFDMLPVYKLTRSLAYFVILLAPT